MLALNCWVSGQSARRIFLIRIHEKETVSDLQKAIKNTKRVFRDVDAGTLTLHQVSILVDQNLEQKLQNPILGNPLLSVNRLRDVFLDIPKDEHIHIVVTTLSDATISLTSRKRSSSSTPQVGQAAKRTKIEDLLDAPNKLGGATSIQTRCAAIHKAIKALPDDLDLSNPSTFVDLPFPSLIPTLPQCFEKTRINNIDHFKYMGRSQFRELQQRVEKEDFLSAREKLCLYGTSGSGTSHLLSALVCDLVRKGKSVFYIPDCSALLLQPTKAMWIALNFARYNSATLGTKEIPQNVDDMIALISGDENLYIIVDQVNALDTTAEDSTRDLKIKVSRWLDALMFGNRYVFSASANETSNREVDRKQRPVSVFRIFAGMNKDETNQWFIHYRHQIPQLLDEQRQLVEHLTGCVPLLLRCLCDLEIFDELEFRCHPALTKVQSDVDTFCTTKYPSLPSLLQQRYLTIMWSCVMGGSVPIDNRSLYDLRYFYIDEEKIGHFTCGIALETIIPILRELDKSRLLGQSSYTAVKGVKNPVVRGFLAEQICLSHIATNGLTAVHERLGSMGTANFNTSPNFDDFLFSDQTVHLYIPNAYNFRTVDGVILLLNRTAKRAIMFSIQFTLSQKHKQSAEEFHTDLWPKWVEPLVLGGFDVESTFVWIDKGQPSRLIQREVIKSFRSHDKIVLPEYTVVYVGVDMVDPRLAAALELKL